MNDDDGVRLLTYREAAARVIDPFTGRPKSIRTMWRWRKKGMPMTWGIRDGQKVRLVREDVLLAYWRARMQGWPIHQYRLRAMLAADMAERDDMEGTRA